MREFRTLHFLSSSGAFSMFTAFTDMIIQQKPMANHLIFFESTIRPHFAKHAGDFWAKKLARNLTDTLISRPPDCATIGRNNMLWPWRSFLRSNYPTETNWRSCNDSINSGSGALWMRNVIASFAAKWLSSTLNSKDKNTCDRNSWWSGRSGLNGRGAHKPYFAPAARRAHGVIWTPPPETQGNDQWCRS